MKKVKQVFEIAWKTGVIVLALCSIAVVGIVVYALNKERSVPGHKVSRTLEIRTLDDQQGLYNTSLHKFIVKELDWICYNPGEDNISVYNKRGRRGFYNAISGELVTDAIYDKAWVFADSLGAVEKDGLLGFINPQGEEQIPFQYRIVRASDEWPEAIQFLNGQCLLKMTPESSGVINKAGNWVVEPNRYSYVSQLSEDSCRIVAKDGKYGIINYRGEEIITPLYESISFADDKGTAFFTQNDRKYLASYEGKVIQPFVFDNIEDEETNGYSRFMVNGNYGILRKKDMKVVIPPKFQTIIILSDGTFQAQLPLGDATNYPSFILLDSNNKILTPKEKI